jgi:hypothetical protein
VGYVLRKRVSGEPRCRTGRHWPRDTQGMDYPAARDVQNSHVEERSIMSSRG